jgi:hypothetical protein
MTYRVEITAPTIHELSGKLAALASQLKGLPSTFDVLRVEAAEVAAPKVAAPPPQPEPQPEIKDEPVAPVDGTAPREVDNGWAKETGSARVYDYNSEVAPRVLQMVGKCGRDAVKELLAKYNVTRASQLDASHYPSLMDAVNAAMED